MEAEEPLGLDVKPDDGRIDCGAFRVDIGQAGPDCPANAPHMFLTGQGWMAVRIHERCVIDLYRRDIEFTGGIPNGLAESSDTLPGLLGGVGNGNEFRAVA